MPMFSNHLFMLGNYLIWGMVSLLIALIPGMMLYLLLLMISSVPFLPISHVPLSIPVFERRENYPP
jgi:hypothetical protein